MPEPDLKSYGCNDCLNSQHGCINKIIAKNPCPGGILETDLIQIEEEGKVKQKIPLHLEHKCKGRKKIPWYKIPGKKEKKVA